MYIVPTLFFALVYLGMNFFSLNRILAWLCAFSIIVYFYTNFSPLVRSHSFLSYASGRHILGISLVVCYFQIPPMDVTLVDMERSRLRRPGVITGHPSYARTHPLFPGRAFHDCKSCASKNKERAVNKTIGFFIRVWWGYFSLILWSCSCRSYWSIWYGSECNLCRNITKIWLVCTFWFLMYGVKLFVSASWLICI